ncbi:MAG TPA: LuxR C-terminal-related transcriptional regulator [Pyrinomonadaceae bacterium]
MFRDPGGLRPRLYAVARYRGLSKARLTRAVKSVMLSIAGSQNMLVEGHSYKTAAAELHVSVNTIKFHLRHIYDKLQVHTKSEAVAKALRHGLTR